ncbi:MAG TPA: hypothetical protein VFW45_12290 [Candidatus Polarisedimenticolia bacterium]|nr:hypothetical protein [Candidatus Polarisedimenticolia bacterium]
MLTPSSETKYRGILSLFLRGLLLRSLLGLLLGGYGAHLLSRMMVCIFQRQEFMLSSRVEWRRSGAEIIESADPDLKEGMILR